MDADAINFDIKAIKRLEIILKLKDKLITQVQAARGLNCTDRNIRYLLRAYNSFGAAALVHGLAGKTGNRTFSAAFKSKVLHLVKNKYSDFSPTFAAQMLKQRDDISLSKETLRQWMIQDGIWQDKVAKHRIHPPRDRRQHYGSLIQIDGSHHDWFEGRSDKCCLIVFIDDATSKIQFMRFFNSETTNAYFNVMDLYIRKFGLPQELYSDKHRKYLHVIVNLLRRCT